jgi:hypothetical protein
MLEWNIVAPLNVHPFHSRGKSQQREIKVIVLSRNRNLAFQRPYAISELLLEVLEH